MRKVFYSISAFAAAAIALISCQKQEISLPEPNMVTVTLTAEKAGVDTKTAAVEGDASVSYVWTDEDKTNLKLLTVSEKDGKETLTVVENPSIAISSDNKILTITATVEENSTLRATVTGKWTSSNNPRVNENQSPMVDNFDPNADVLISDDITVSELTDASLTFRRQASINKMTLKGLEADEKIREIKLTSNKSLTGYFNGKTAVGDNSTLTLSYADVTVAENGEFPVYFSVLPGEAHTLTVVVKSDKNTYTKEFGAGKINFALGKFMKFSVNLEGCGEEVVDTDYSGQWVFVGTNGEKHYAALAYASGNNNLRTKEVTLDVDNEQIKSTDVTSIQMTLKKVTTENYAGLYTIQDASGNYLYAAGTDKNYLKGTKDLDGADYYWNIEKEASGAYTIKATKSSTERNTIRYNATSNVFSCYSSGQNDIYLYPATWLVEEETPITIDFTTVAELNALATSTATMWDGSLENAVVSFVPDANNAIIKDATGSILVYKQNHGLKQGQTFTGDFTPTIKLFNGTAEITDLDTATFTGEEKVVEPESLTLADLVGNIAKYQNAYVKVDDLTVTSVSGKNINVENGANTYVVFSSAADATCVAGDVISVVGTIAQYKSTDQIKAWTADAITVTGSGTGDEPGEEGGPYTLTSDDIKSAHTSAWSYTSGTKSITASDKSVWTAYNTFASTGQVTLQMNTGKGCYILTPKVSGSIKKITIALAAKNDGTGTGSRACNLLTADGTTIATVDADNLISGYTLTGEYNQIRIEPAEGATYISSITIE